MPVEGWDCTGLCIARKTTTKNTSTAAKNHHLLQGHAPTTVGAPTVVLAVYFYLKNMKLSGRVEL
jgi:hypothetical protein